MMKNKSKNFTKLILKSYNVVDDTKGVFDDEVVSRGNNNRGSKKEVS